MKEGAEVAKEEGAGEGRASVAAHGWAQSAALAAAEQQAAPSHTSPCPCSLAAADHDGNLHALAGRRGHLAGDGLQHGGVDAKALGPLQRLAADLEHHAAAGTGSGARGVETEIAGAEEGGRGGGGDKCGGCSI